MAGQVRGDELDRPVVIKLESESASHDGSALILELLVTPASPIDPPAELELILGDESRSEVVPLLQDEEILFSEKLISVAVPRRLLGNPGEPKILPFLIKGRTLRDQPIHEPGRWELSNFREAFRSLTGSEIREAWPGASGSPVNKNAGFYGRDRDINNLVSLLASNDRPGSVMLFGERRIGKTSLLWQVVDLPPSPGRVCAAFCDVSDIEDRPASMAKAFFDKIITDLETKGVVNYQTGTGQASAQKKIARLVRNAKADPTVSIAGALEILAKVPGSTHRRSHRPARALHRRVRSLCRADHSGPPRRSRKAHVGPTSGHTGVATCGPGSGGDRGSAAVLRRGS